MRPNHDFIVDEHLGHELNARQNYRKVASSNRSCLEAHAGIFRLLMKGIFDPYVLTVTF